MDKIFGPLNESQKDAVQSTEGRIKVVAGAGSGKTRVLAHRYAHLVNNFGVDSANILCMTFTNKAAQEMRGRISKLVEDGIGNDLICTIHGFCVKILRRDIYRLGWPQNFKILDEDDTEQIAKQVLELHNLDRTKHNVKELLEDVSIFKKSIRPSYIDVYMLAESIKFGDTSNFNSSESFLHYQALNYCLNFDDIVSFALYLLENYKEVREYWQDQANYVMVDEAQDCNTTDWRIATLISSKYNNLFVVGDPDQAIYEWRGATPQDFVEWKADRTIVLARNYRSTPDILGVANSVIANNKNRIPKNLYTERPTYKIATHFHAKNDAEEADYVVKEIKRLNENGVSYSDIAILYRASHVSRSIEQVLLREKLPYEVWGGVRFYERKEIKDVLAYLNLLVSDDNLSFSRIINVPRRNFGPASLKKIRDYSEITGLSYLQVLREKVDEWKSTKAYRPLKQFINLIDESRSIYRRLTIIEILNHILKSSGLTSMLREDTETDRLENIEELLSSVRQYEQQNEDDEVTLDKYLQDIALLTNMDREKNESSVKLMTIHQSKGLEFPAVFVCGLSEGIFPSHRSLRERKLNGLEEERRLMYVAVTRAEKYLYLTEAEGFNFQTRTDKYPSRFLAEIAENMVLREGSMDNSLWEGTKALSMSIDSEVKILHNGSAEELTVGTIVSHEYLGIGKIMEINEDGSRAKVRFGDDGSSDRYLLTKMLKKA